MRHSLESSFNDFPLSFDSQAHARAACGSAWGLVADRLSPVLPSARPAAVVPSTPKTRSETADQSSFSMSGFG